MNKQVKKIVIFGDSVLKPVIINEGRYAVSKAVDWFSIEEKLGVKIENRAKMGATVRHGLERLNRYLNENSDVYAVVMEFGGNDCDYNWEKVASDGNVAHPPKVEPEEFESLLSQMIDTCIEHGVKPILMSLPPISALRYYEWIIGRGLDSKNILKHLGDIEVISRHQAYYNDIVVKTAMRRGIDLVDVRGEFLLRKDFYDLVCIDGIHPSEKGEQLIVNAFLEKYLNNEVL